MPDNRHILPVGHSQRWHVPGVVEAIRVSSPGTSGSDAEGARWASTQHNCVKAGPRSFCQEARSRTKPVAPHWVRAGSSGSSAREAIPDLCRVKRYAGGRSGAVFDTYARRVPPVIASGIPNREAAVDLGVEHHTRARGAAWLSYPGLILPVEVAGVGDLLLSFRPEGERDRGRLWSALCQAAPDNAPQVRVNAHHAMSRRNQFDPPPRVVRRIIS